MADSPPKIKVLFIKASPPGGEPLDHDTELRGLQELQRFDVIPVIAAKVADVLPALRAHEPQILHFAGHGDKTGALVFNNVGGTSYQFLRGEQLAEMLWVHQAEAKAKVQLVVLAGCNTAPSADLAAEHVGCAIGMDDKVSDTAVARWFTPALYAALADGRSIQNSLESAVATLRSQKQPFVADAVTICWRDGVDPTKLVLTAPAAPASSLSPLHRAYLERLSEQRWAAVSMSLFKTRLAQREKLPEIYVPLPIDFAITGRFDKRGQLKEWWCGRRDERGDAAQESAANRREMKLAAKLRRDVGFGEPAPPRAWADLRVDEAGLKPLVALAFGEGKQDQREAQETLTWRADAEHALLVQRRFVLTGDPGSGKSSFLRRLALAWAGELLAGREADSAAGNAAGNAAGGTDFLPRPAFTPIYIELRSLVALVFPALTADSACPPALPGLSEFREYLQKHLLKPALPGRDGQALDDLLFDLLHAGQAAVLLDGLDEVNQAADANRQAQVEAFVGALAEEFDRAPIIVTSRSYAYRPGGWELPGFGRTALVPLDRERELAIAGRLFARLSTPSSGRRDDTLPAFEAALDRIPADLASNPLLLTLLVALWLNRSKDETEALPRKRGELYRRALELLIEDWINAKTEGFSLRSSPVKMSVDELLFVLQLVACYAQERRTQADELPIITQGDIFEALQWIGRGTIAVELLKHLEQQAGMLLDLVDETPTVLVAPGAKVFRFLHLSFQEYLAACELLYRDADESRPFRLPVPGNRRFPAGLVDHLVKGPELWANVLRLATDQLLYRSRAPDAWELLHDCCEPYRKGGEAAPAAVQAFQAALETEADLFSKPRDPRAEMYYRHLVEAAQKALADHTTFSPEQRFIAGQLLGSGPYPGHDTRKGVGLRREDGLPDIDWVCVPEKHPATGQAEFSYQNGERRTEPDFWIARFPITYAQFEAFANVEDDGFFNPAWWQGLSADADDRRAPGQQRFEFWNHPRVNVSWYDAVAFCRWLTAKAESARDLLPVELRGAPGWRITLPTEQQWEKAARGHDGRAYPWGPEYESGRANVNETYGQRGSHYLQSTSAAGMYPHGASPCGAQDMSGNVWEWCLNSYDDPAYIKPEGASTRVVRGGSWSLFVGFAAARVRYWYYPDFRNDSSGLRVVVLRGGVPVR
jgi:formylglycine-generating enzyme required for sulfatase activity